MGKNFPLSDDFGYTIRKSVASSLKVIASEALRYP